MKKKFQEEEEEYKTQIEDLEKIVQLKSEEEHEQGKKLNESRVARDDLNMQLAQKSTEIKKLQEINKQLFKDSQVQDSGSDDVFEKMLIMF